MHDIRKTYITAAGKRVPYTATYELSDWGGLNWSASASFDGDWERIGSGALAKAVLGDKDVLITNSIERLIEKRILGKSW